MFWGKYSMHRDSYPRSVTVFCSFLIKYTHKVWYTTKVALELSHPKSCYRRIRVWEVFNSNLVDEQNKSICSGLPKPVASP